MGKYQASRKPGGRLRWKCVLYDKLEDGTFSGVISQCRGVLAFSETLRGCEAELQSVLEDWILLGLKLGHDLPVMEGIDLNREPTVAATESM
jgi:predicted RNase H-like HicB family nuclease